MHMKRYVTAGFVCLLLGTSALAQELPGRFAIAALVEKDHTGTYKLAWQRRLLAIQKAFAADIASQPSVDYTATGSITPIDQEPRQQ